MSRYPLRSRRLVFGALLCMAGAAHAAPAEMTAAAAKKFFNAKGCNACHELQEYRIGPSYQVVAMRYAAGYAAEPKLQVEKLAMKIRFGGAGAWGAVPMVSNPGLSEQEAADIATWILHQAQPTTQQAPQ